MKQRLTKGVAELQYPHLQVLMGRMNDLDDIRMNHSSIIAANLNNKNITFNQTIKVKNT